MAQQENKGQTITKQIKLDDNDDNQTLCAMAIERLCKSHGQEVTAAAVLVVRASMLQKTTHTRKTQHEIEFH
jgi:hypothetical protein